MDWLNNKFINNSEVARAIGIEPTLFRRKLKVNKHTGFTENEKIFIEAVRKTIKKSL